MTSENTPASAPEPGEGKPTRIPGSGDAAVAAAAERARETGVRNVPVLDGLSIPEDTANLRLGPNLNDAMLALLPLVGVWRGQGEGHDDEHGDFHFHQQIVVTHNGGDYLSWQAQGWTVDEKGAFEREVLRESGYWRVAGDSTVGAENDEVLELLLAHSSGLVELYYGEARTQSSWELATDVVMRSTSGALLGGAKRLYGIVEGGDLAYVEERTMADGAMVPRMSARLQRYIG